MSKLSTIALVSALVLTPTITLAADVSAAATAAVGTTLGLGDLVTNLNGSGDDGTALTAISAATDKSTIIIVPLSSMTADAGVDATALGAAETHASGRLGSLRAAVRGSDAVEAALVAKGFKDSQIVGAQADASATTGNPQNNTGGTIWIYVDDRA